MALSTMHDEQTDAPFVMNKQTLTPTEHGRYKPLNESLNRRWKVVGKEDKTVKVNITDGKEIDEAMHTSEKDMQQ